MQMIERDDLGNAIALNSSMVNGALLIGPAIAGSADRDGGRGLLFPDRRLQLHGGNRLAVGNESGAGAIAAKVGAL